MFVYIVSFVGAWVLLQHNIISYKSGSGKQNGGCQSLSEGEIEHCLVGRVSVLQDEKILKIYCVTMRIYLMLLNTLE